MENKIIIESSYSGFGGGREGDLSRQDVPYN
jgi:hypothetical protein